MDGKKYQEILEYELITAMGCTEPIAIAFVAAKAADILGGVPDKMRVRCSGNIIKNVHGVIIPNTANKRGICVAAIAGALVGHAERNLDVLESMNKESIEKIDALLHSGMCSEERLETETNLAIDIIAQKGDDTAEVRLRESHTNITYIEKNGITIYEAERLENDNKAAKIPDSSTLSIRGIYEYAHQCDTDRIEPLLNRQISYNIAIAEEGIRNGYGSEVGRTILAAFGSSLESQAIAPLGQNFSCCPWRY